MQFPLPDIKENFGPPCQFKSIFMGLKFCVVLSNQKRLLFSCSLWTDLSSSWLIFNNNPEILISKTPRHIQHLLAGIATAMKKKIVFDLSSRNLQLPLQHWRLTEFAVVETGTIITNNYMFFLPWQCLHVLCLILDFTIKWFPTLTYLWEQ